eukprot:TRINITY_DN5164_c0_g2_i1.p1 TRINITY_DN5164_c0_g2~~TRINITY_DN5164_c0_g2_i1.p1  ORF type:complete len:369 (+),score=39.75 TRINITY_DN5164_c0_g2_i1:39-1145(+)
MWFRALHRRIETPFHLESVTSALKTMSVLWWMSLVVVAASSSLDESDAVELLQTPVPHVRIPRTSTEDKSAQLTGSEVRDAISTRPKAIVHVGAHKAGSTSLQATLARYRSFLASDAFGLYPDSYAGEVKSRFPLLLRDVSYCMQSRPLLSASSCNHSLSHFRTFLEGAQQTNQDIVLSSEYFGMAGMNVTVLAEALQGFETKIVVFHRPYFEWIQSLYNQKTKFASDRPAHSTTSKPLETFAMKRALVSASGLDSSSIAVYNRYSEHFRRVSMRALAPHYIRRFVCDDVQAKTLCWRLLWTQEMRKNEKGSIMLQRRTACMNASEKELFWTVSVGLEVQAMALIGEGQTLNVTDFRARFDRSSFNFC